MDHAINPATGRPWKVGDSVTKGDQVGTLSDIGSKNMNHVHFALGTVVCGENGDIHYEIGEPNGCARDPKQPWKPVIKDPSSNDPERDPNTDTWLEEWVENYGSPEAKLRWERFYLKLQTQLCKEADDCHKSATGRARGLVSTLGSVVAKAVIRAIAEPERTDPLILDLDGDGIETTSVYFGAYFDHGGDGVAELSAWIDTDDGMLVMDRNGDGFVNDGGELFGDQTPMADGSRAADGFAALAALDDNGDGVIDARDAAFAQLRVGKNVEEGVDEHDYLELYTLDEMGITSISLVTEPDGSVDQMGNIRNRVGSFETSDGEQREIAAYTLQSDPIFGDPGELIEITEDVAALPDLDGYGQVTDLSQAMMRDNSGQLKSLVEQFVTSLDVSARNTLMHDILFKWTSTEGIDPSSAGPHIDARRFALIEKFVGQSLVELLGPKPNYQASVFLDQSYHEIFEITYSLLMAQTHLKDVYDTLEYVWDEDSEQYTLDTTALIATLDQAIADDPVSGQELLSEFARTRRGMGYHNENCFLSLREHFIQLDPDLGWVFDTGGLDVYDQLGQGDGWYYPHMFGTYGSEVVKGSATEGDGYINSLSGNDVLYGTDRDEVLLNQDGDALFVAGGGNDRIWAGDGADIIDGGEGNDTLYGEAGDDTYIFRIGSGNDTIIDIDTTEGNLDTIFIGSSLTPDDVTLKRVGNNLVLAIVGTSDSITVQGFFSNDSTLYRVEQVQFMDGTLWSESDIVAKVYEPTDNDDFIYGGSDADELSGARRKRHHSWPCLQRHDSW